MQHRRVLGISHGIVNVVATTTFDQGIDLDRLAEVLPGARYAPKRFPGLVFKLERPKASFLIFRSGNVVCTGARSEGEALEAFRRLSQLLVEEKVLKPSRVEVKVQNMVCTGHLGVRLDLEKAASTLEEVIYEPEQFPGLIYRGLRTVFLLFASGRFVCVGSKSEQALSEAVKRLRLVLEENDLVEAQE